MNKRRIDNVKFVEEGTFPKTYTKLMMYMYGEFIGFVEFGGVNENNVNILSSGIHPTTKYLNLTKNEITMFGVDYMKMKYGKNLSIRNIGYYQVSKF